MNICRRMLFLLPVFILGTFSLSAQVYIEREMDDYKGGLRIGSVSSITIHESLNTAMDSYSNIGFDLAWEVRSSPHGIGGELSLGILFDLTREDWINSMDKFAEVQIDYGLALGSTGLVLTPMADMGITQQVIPGKTGMLKNYTEITYLYLGGGIEIGAFFGKGFLSLGGQYSILAASIDEPAESFSNISTVQVTLGYTFLL